MLRTAAFWAAALAVMVVGSLVAQAAPASVNSLVWGIVGSVGVYALVRWFAGRSTLSVPDAGIGWEIGSARRFVIGLAVGLAVYAAMIAANAAVFGPIRFSPIARIDWAIIVAIVLGLVATVTMEELVFRSYALWNSVDALGSLGGQIVVALAFSALHLLYGWAPMTVLLGVLPSAILFGAAAIVSRGLAMPLGVHLGIVVARWIAGEGDQPILLAMDTSGMNQAAAGTFAPLLSAIVPLVAAAAILAVGRRARDRR